MCCRCNKKGSPEANAFGLGFCAGGRRMPPAAYFFLACQKKVCKKETLGTRIALRA
jgi:hypothetical protein